MKGSKEAMAVWDEVPRASRKHFFNGIDCITCSEPTNLENMELLLVLEDLIILGDCVECGTKISQHVYLDALRNNIKEDKEYVLSRPCYHKLKKLVSFPKNAKFAQSLEKMTPLEVKSQGKWKLAVEKQSYAYVQDNYIDQAIYRDVFSLGDRPCWEMEQILPGEDLDLPDEEGCPILKGIFIHERYGESAAIKHYHELLEIEPRCVDAYSHLGNIYYYHDTFSSLEKAKRYYKQGVAVSLQAIGNRIYDVFSWGNMDNRPFLRSLQGLGACLLKENKKEDALSVFRHMVLLTPIKDQGAGEGVVDAIGLPINY